MAMNHDNFLTKCNECLELIYSMPHFAIPLEIKSGPSCFSGWERSVTWYLYSVNGKGQAWAGEYEEFIGDSPLRRVLTGKAEGT